MYPDKPEFRDAAEGAGIRAVRRDQYAMIGVTEGEVMLPAVDLPWWNIDAGAWEVASLPATVLNILPSATAAPPPPPPVEEAAEEESGPAIETEIVYVDFWRYVSAGLGAVWLMTVIGWWWSRRPLRTEPKEPPPPPIHKQQAKSLKVARKAALDGDAAGVKAAVLEWGRLQWPDDPPRSVGVVARRVSLPLATELEALCSATYGRGAKDWNGEALAKSLRSFAVLSEDAAERRSDGLPPLSPLHN
jgi:hypothetical protein